MREINLIAVKSILSPYQVNIANRMKIAGLVTLSVSILLAIIVGAVYFFWSRQLQTLENDKLQLVQSINALSTREGILRSLKEQVRVTGNVMSKQTPWSLVLDTVESFASPPILSSIQLNEKKEILATFGTGSVEESIGIVENLIVAFGEQKLKNPILSSYALESDGSVDFSLTFAPVF